MNKFYNQGTCPFVQLCSDLTDFNSLPDSGDFCLLMAILKGPLTNSEYPD